MTAHPRTEFAAELPPIPAGPLRLPAEFEPLARVWVQPPTNPETWPGCLPRAQQDFGLFTHVLERHVEVARLDRLGVATNDSWVRDFGPLFVKDAAGRVALHDFHFNSWGGKYEPRPLDDVVPQHLAHHQGRALRVHDVVLEGGAIDVNGRGTVLTTRSCVLAASRGRMSAGGFRKLAQRELGATRVVFLAGGFACDDTDGHVDNLARFVAADRVLACRAQKDHPDREVLEKNWRTLKRTTDQDGNRLEVLPLPVPDPMWFDYPADDYVAGGVTRLAASYANFLIANRAVFVPVFGQPRDDAALAAVEDAMPGHRVYGIPAASLLVGGGTLHCLTMHEPVSG